MTTASRYLGFETKYAQVAAWFATTCTDEPAEEITRKERSGGKVARIVERIVERAYTAAQLMDNFAATFTECELVVADGGGACHTTQARFIVTISGAPRGLAALKAFEVPASYLRAAKAMGASEDPDVIAIHLNCEEYDEDGEEAN